MTATRTWYSENEVVGAVDHAGPVVCAAAVDAVVAGGDGAEVQPLAVGRQVVRLLQALAVEVPVDADFAAAVHVAPEDHVAILADQRRRIGVLQIHRSRLGDPYDKRPNLFRAFITRLHCSSTYRVDFKKSKLDCLL